MSEGKSLTASAVAAGKSSDNYNGNSTEKYSWSQTISELDVRIPVSKSIRKGKDVAVTIKSDFIDVRLVAQLEAEPLISGELAFPIHKEEACWNLIPGDAVTIFLQKTKDRWWTTLLKTGEEPIDASSIEAVVPMEDLQEEEQMKVSELMWKQQQKEKGISTTDNNLEKILKKSWNAEGSPFKGIPYDPTLVNFQQDSLPPDLLARVIGSNSSDQ